MQDEYQSSGELENEMKQLLDRIEQEPVSNELRSLAKQLQKLMEDRKETENSLD
ncbi:hypothetical protein [Yoonia sp.]|uniref:hypothetical protein n=1 Tax=Yoonia sp. TaxID=2212373 RepID=UPI00391D22A9